MGYQHLLILTGWVPLLLLGSTVQAQYYYSDLVAAKQTEKKQSTYRLLKVKKINELASLPSGEQQADYQQYTLVSSNADTNKQYRVESGKSIILTTLFDREGKLTEQTEKQIDRLISTRYSRNNLGLIKWIENSVNDRLISLIIRETHNWEYDEKGRPVRMWKRVEQSDGTIDSSEIRLELDAMGRVMEERTFKKGIETDFLYYYYSENGLISDMVRYNKKWKKLLPDQLFEYDTTGNMIQRIQLTGMREASYLIWRFDYERNGLLTEEGLFNNLKQHTGSIRYTYEFYQP
ncbi:MAG: hypothetical protein FJX92_04040 [Bacteroidetes bacterium]|nr:hypothetical protein [Bacteroidota bacterium]